MCNACVKIIKDNGDFGAPFDKLDLGQSVVDWIASDSERDCLPISRVLNKA